LAVQLQPGLGGALHQGLGREQEPGLFLGAETPVQSPQPVDARRQGDQINSAGATLGSQGQEGGGITQTGAEVEPPAQIRLALVEQGQGRGKGAVGAGLIAIQRQGGAKLGPRHGGGEGIELGLGVIAQITDDGAGVAGQDVEGIGQILATRLALVVAALPVGGCPARTPPRSPA
jgi:hypothetical protein